MGLYEKFSGNPNAEKDGVWITVDDTDNFKPVQIKLAFAGQTNPAFMKAGEKRQRVLRQVTQDAETNLAIARDVFCEACIKDWKNVIDRSGQPMECNRENAKQLMKDLPRLYEWLVLLANDPSTFSDAESNRDLGAEAKN